MKICLLGSFYGPLDEAGRIISTNLARELSRRNDVLALDLRKAFFKDFWISLKRFEPNIVHYIPGGSAKSLLLLKLIKKFSSAKFLLSITQFTGLPDFIKFLKPDLVLAQTSESEIFFRKLGFRVKFLPIGGVDLNRFHPELRKNKERFREKYGIDKDRPVLLHVGSIKKGRNVEAFKKIKKEEPEYQVLIVGSVSVGIDWNLLQDLKRAGCVVFTHYIENIEEVYALSDCYIFPVLPKGPFNRKPAAIDIPLSVLEAMACNLPVITTEFGALPRIFKPGKGLVFVKKVEDIVSAIREASCGTDIENRSKVKDFSWSRVAEKCEKVYEELLRK